MKMKKMMFLMLTLLILGLASMNAQVQIGGTNGPDPSVVLDLNGDDGTAVGGLLLPRVDLTSATQQLVAGSDPVEGTIVYNINPDFGIGTYVWQDNVWNNVASNTTKPIPGTFKRARIIEVIGTVNTASQHLTTFTFAGAPADIQKTVVVPHSCTVSESMTSTHNSWYAYLSGPNAISWFWPRTNSSVQFGNLRCFVLLVEYN